MKQLTDYQKEFLLEHFFKNEQYAGWRGIAIKLLEKGKCTVAGSTDIWKGGIGNFIRTTDAVDAVDCTLYTFDLENFLTSEWYKDIKRQYVQILLVEKTEAERKYKEVSELAQRKHEEISEL